MGEFGKIYEIGEVEKFTFRSCEEGKEEILQLFNDCNTFICAQCLIEAVIIHQPTGQMVCPECLGERYSVEEIDRAQKKIE